jgi:hypothetical protein
MPLQCRFYTSSAHIRGSCPAAALVMTDVYRTACRTARTARPVVGLPLSCVQALPKGAAVALSLEFGSFLFRIYHPVHRHVNALGSEQFVHASSRRKIGHTVSSKDKRRLSQGVQEGPKVFRPLHSRRRRSRDQISVAFSLIPCWSTG